MAKEIDAEFRRVRYTDKDGVQQVCGHTHTQPMSATSCGRIIAHRLLRASEPGWPEHGLHIDIQTVHVTAGTATPPPFPAVADRG